MTPADASSDDTNGDGVPDDSQQGVPVTFEVHARGVIDAIDVSSLTVGGVTFAIDGSTVWLDRTGAATVPSAFAAGQPVAVEGVRQSDGSVLATRTASASTRSSSPAPSRRSTRAASRCVV